MRRRNGDESGQGQRHSLVGVVVIPVCGVPAGADGPAAIFTWADCDRDWPKRDLELPQDIPSKDCIRRVLQVQQYTLALVA